MKTTTRWIASRHMTNVPQPARGLTLLPWRTVTPALSETNSRPVMHPRMATVAQHRQLASVVSSPGRHSLCTRRRAVGTQLPTVTPAGTGLRLLVSVPNCPTLRASGHSTTLSSVTAPVQLRMQKPSQTKGMYAHGLFSLFRPTVSINFHHAFRGKHKSRCNHLPSRR